MLGANTVVALVMFLATAGLLALIVSIDSRQPAPQPGPNKPYLAGAVSQASFGASLPATE